MSRLRPIDVSLSPSRILVRGVNWLGDAVMTTPALRRLRERFPHARITLLTPAKLAALWLHHPSIDNLIAFGPEESALAIGQRLRSERFDLALVLPNSPRSALECRAGRIGLRVGYAGSWRDWFLTGTVPRRPGHMGMTKRSPREIRRLNRTAEHSPVPPPAAHQLHDYLHLVAALGANPAVLAPHLEITPAEMEQTRLALLGGRANTATKGMAGLSLPLLGLNPGAEYGPAKRWPPENFVAATRQVSRRLGPCLWLLFGGVGDWRLCHEITQAMGDRAINLAGRTSLRDLMGLLKLCRVLLTNDTGPMHLAAALGTPVVVPFGSTSWALTGPGVPGDSLHRFLTVSSPCAPCFRRTCPIDFRCMTRLSPHLVTEAVMAVLETRNG